VPALLLLTAQLLLRQRPHWLCSRLAGGRLLRLLLLLLLLLWLRAAW
jgi:hypothetical protein